MKQSHLERDCWARIEEEQKRAQQKLQSQVNDLQVIEEDNREREPDELLSVMSRREN